MDSKAAKSVALKIEELQTLMIAYVTGERSDEQPHAYKNLYDEVYFELEDAHYENPNPHKSLEVFWSYCKLQGMDKYASRRAYVREIYSDILLELKRIQRHVASSRNWKKANDALDDELSPVRTQWLKAKNFVYSASPDYENAIKEAINSIESCLMVLLESPNGTLGKLIKSANLDADIERLISQAYGFTSNKDFVRHGGVSRQDIFKEEAEFFLELAATSIVYITAKLKHDQ